MKDVDIGPFIRLRTIHLILKAKNIEKNESLRRRQIGSVSGGKFVPNARISGIYNRSNSTIYFTSFNIPGNKSKPRKLVLFDLKPRNNKRRYCISEMLYE